MEITRQAWRVKEFLDAFRIGRTKFYQMVSDREIRIIKSGRTTLIPISSVESWLAACEKANEKAMRRRSAQ